MPSDYTPRKENKLPAFESPYPGFGGVMSDYEVRFIESYGHACAEAARSPLAEENARLKEQVQRLLERLEIESEDDQIDGIFCRNTTIRELDEDRDAVAKQRDEARARIAELEAEVNLWREIQAAVAQLEGAGPEWPAHGNAPLAITAGYALHKMQADRLRAEVESLESLLDLYWKSMTEKSRDKVRAKAGEWVNPLAAEVEALTAANAAFRADAERLSRFESWAGVGLCPTLLFDDDGHWFVSFDGFGPVGAVDGIHSSFATGEWHETVRAAIDAAGVYVESEFEHIAARKAESESQLRCSGEGSEG